MGRICAVRMALNSRPLERNTLVAHGCHLFDDLDPPNRKRHGFPGGSFENKNQQGIPPPKKSTDPHVLLQTVATAESQKCQQTPCFNNPSGRGGWDSVTIVLLQNQIRFPPCVCGGFSRKKDPMERMGEVPLEQYIVFKVLPIVNLEAVQISRG